MIEIAVDVRCQCPNCKQHIGEYLRPCTEDSQESIKGLKLYTMFKARLYGIKKPRSVKQLNLYWAVCGLVAELVSDHEKRFTKDDIDFKTKIRVAKRVPSMIKRFELLPDGTTWFEPISIALANLEHLDACRYFDKAYKIMAENTQVEKDELIAMAKDRMK